MRSALARFAVVTVVAVLAAALLGPVGTPAARAAVEHPRVAVEPVWLGGVRAVVSPATTQVVTVRHTRGHRARVVLWERQAETLGQTSGSGWHRVLQTTDGRIGYGGLVLGHRRRQGSGTTPIGTYRLPWAFGTGPRRPAWGLDYRRIRPGDHWVQDNASRFYNRYRNRSQGGFRWWLPSSDPNSSERLLDYRRQYEFSVVIGFNPGQVRHRGAGIFLHVNGPGATAGCVSVPRALMRELMATLDPEQRPVIAIGPRRARGQRVGR